MFSVPVEREGGISVTTNASLVRRMDNESLALLFSEIYNAGVYDGYHSELHTNSFSWGTSWLESPADMDGTVEHKGLVERLRKYSETLVAYKLDADFADAVMEAANELERLANG